MSQSKVYVGNLSYRTTEDELMSKFSEFGGVSDVKIIMDRETGRSKGFGFITFESPEGAKGAIEALDGQDFGGRNIRVNIAKDDGGRRSGGGGRF